MNSKPLFEKAAFIGIGLIGSSLARAMRARGLVGEITASARRQETIDTALELAVCDFGYLDPAEAVKGADLIVLCVPVGSNAAVAEAMAPALAKGAVVTDVGSVKEAVIRDVGPHLPEGVHFVPGHPVAGTENSGPAAGFAELFEDRYCILTPTKDADPEAVEKIKALWKGVGSMVQIMDAQHHDKILAVTSHLPHIIAYTIVGTAFDLDESERGELLRYSAGGFRDFTRIAGSDPVMWRDIFLNNREAVLEILQRFNEDLTELQKAIRWGNGDKLEALFTRTREIRSGVLDLGQAGTFDAREPEKAVPVQND